MYSLLILSGFEKSKIDKKRINNSKIAKLCPLLNRIKDKTEDIKLSVKTGANFPLLNTRMALANTISRVILESKK